MFLKKQAKKSKISSVAALVFILAALFLGRNYIRSSFVSQKISEAAVYAARPALALKNKTRGAIDNIFANFRFKKDLNILNQKLREENLKLKAESSRVKILENENSELLKILGARGKEAEENRIVASVLFYPPASGFDAFIINIGAQDGVKKGMKTVFENSVILGETEEIYEKTSKVKLYSFYGNKINVYLENSLFYVAASGRGGENFEIILPKNAEVSEGERIFFAGTNFTLGKTEKIIKNENEPFQKIYFRYPFNLSELRFVSVIK